MFSKIPEQFSSYVALPKTEEAREAARQRMFAAMDKCVRVHEAQLAKAYPQTDKIRGQRHTALIIDEFQFTPEETAKLGL